MWWWGNITARCEWCKVLRRQANTYVQGLPLCHYAKVLVLMISSSISGIYLCKLVCVSDWRAHQIMHLATTLKGVIDSWHWHSSVCHPNSSFKVERLFWFLYFLTSRQPNHLPSIFHFCKVDFFSMILITTLYCVTVTTIVHLCWHDIVLNDTC